MKKIFLFAALAVSMTIFNGCSGDDNGSTADNKITAKINGIATTFDLITVDHEFNTLDGVQYELITIHASSTTSDTAMIFSVDKGKTGTNALDSMRFTLANVYYYGFTDSDFMVNITANSTGENKLKGTFSGTIHNGNSGNIPVTNGIMDFTY